MSFGSTSVLWRAAAAAAVPVYLAAMGSIAHSSAQWEESGVSATVWRLASGGGSTSVIDVIHDVDVGAL